MGGILVYALHDDEGEFNKNSLGALSEASKLAGELGGEAAAVVVGDVSDDAAAGLGKYGVKKVYRAKDAPEGLAQPIVDVMSASTRCGARSTTTSASHGAGSTLAASGPWDSGSLRRCAKRSPPRARSCSTSASPRTRTATR